MNITNNTQNPILLPGETEAIPAGATVPVKRWADIKDHAVVAKFVEAKALTTGGKVQDTPEPDEVDTSPDAQLAELTGEPAPARRGRPRSTPAEE